MRIEELEPRIVEAREAFTGLQEEVEKAGDHTFCNHLCRDRRDVLPALSHATAQR